MAGQRGQPPGSPPAGRGPTPDGEDPDQVQLIPRIGGRYAPLPARQQEPAPQPQATRRLPTAPPPASRPPSRAPATSPAPPPARPSRPRRRRWWLLALLLVIAYPLLLLGLVLLGVQRVPAMPTGERPADGPGQTWVIVGSDSRADLSPQEQAGLSTGQVEGNRTDTILLLTTAPGTPSLISIPRDSLVEIPGNGRNRINAAYAFGGPQLLVQTIESATGVRVDGYVEMGFGGFYRIVQAVGGVQVCPTIPLDDPRAGINLQPGCQVLDGAQALGYVRARYSDPRGDLGRVERQQEFIGSLARRVASPAVLLNPVRAVPLAAAVGDALTIDEGMGPLDLSRFGLAALRSTGGGGQTLTVPIGASTTTSVGSVLLWDDTLAPALWASMRDGTPIPPEVLAYPGSS